MNKLDKVIFNLGVFLCLASGTGTLLEALPPLLSNVGAILGLIMVGIGYAMMRSQR